MCTLLYLHAVIYWIKHALINLNLKIQLCAEASWELLIKLLDLTNNFVSHSGRSIHFRCREEVCRLSVSHTVTASYVRGLFEEWRKLDVTSFHIIHCGNWIQHNLLKIWKSNTWQRDPWHYCSSFLSRKVSVEIKFNNKIWFLNSHKNQTWLNIPLTQITVIYFKRNWPPPKLPFLFDFGHEKFINLKFPP